MTPKIDLEYSNLNGRAEKKNPAFHDCFCTFAGPCPGDCREYSSADIRGREGLGNFRISGRNKPGIRPLSRRQPRSMIRSDRPSAASAGCRTLSEPIVEDLPLPSRRPGRAGLSEGGGHDHRFPHPPDPTQPSRCFRFSTHPIPGQYLSGRLQDIRSHRTRR